MKTIVKVCKCSHEYQDNVYGKTLRVHNLTPGTPAKARCTVCSNEKTLKPNEG